MGPAFEERLRAVVWADYGTAYGPAIKVPDQPGRLAGPNEGAALAASHDLCCGLCHQHAYISSAAVPALPFILEVLGRRKRGTEKKGRSSFRCARKCLVRRAGVPVSKFGSGCEAEPGAGS